MIEGIFNTIVSTMGWSSASWVGIVLTVLALLSTLASQLDSMWSDDTQPKWVSIAVKVLSRNTGKASNDPNTQE